ncbi:MAG: PEP-CTERM sorting domain-containing protein [Desulfobacterales bacterium]
MRKYKLLLLAIVGIVIGMSSSAHALLIEITDINADRAAISEADYATYVNSGDLLGVFEGNDSNQISDIEAWLIANEGYAPGFELTEHFKDEYSEANASRSGTWSTDTAIALYVVKAANAFALYDVDPAAAEGTWSTYDLWIRDLGGRGGITISHLTGYNPTSVPEPATMLLLGTGLIGLVGLSRQKMKK